MFWVYGPGDREITVIGLEPHPADGKNDAYPRVLLSKRPALYLRGVEAVVAHGARGL